VNEAYQRIGGGVLLESSCLVLLCRTVDQVIVGGKGTSTFMRNSLDVCFGAALGLNVMSDVRDGGQNEIRCYQASAKYSLSLQLPPGTRPAVDQRSSKLDGCRAEVDDATPKLTSLFPKRYVRHISAPWLLRPSRGLCRVRHE
jgi:hypothetical protein